MVQGGIAKSALVCLLVAGLWLATAAPASASAYFGATISGETYGETGNAPRNLPAWDRFEHDAGKQVAIVNQGQEWASFDKVEIEGTAARGAIPLVTMNLNGTTLAEVAAGGQDAAIKKWAQEAKAFAHPFLFAPWWEMNGAWYAWGRSPSFVAAWRHFHNLVVAQGATNVTWTWVVNSIWEDPESNPSPWYPGDDYVDWTGLDAYNWGRNPAQPDRWKDPNEAVGPTLKILEELAPAKPVALVEDASTEYGGNKTDWIREMLTTYLPRHPEIAAYLWFNWNFPNNGLRHDWQIESSAPAQEAFRKGIQSGYFASRPVSLPNLTKVPPPPPGSADPAQAADLSAAAEVTSGPDVAVAPNGITTVVWSARAAGGNFTVYMRRIAPDGTRSPAVALSNPAGDALAPQVAVALDGSATVVWSRFDGTSFQVQGRRVDPQGTPEVSTKNLSRTGQDAADPQVAVAPDGTATVVWKRFDGFHDRVEERRITAAGERLPAESTNLLSAEKQDAVEPAVASAPDGISTVVWSRFDGEDSIVQRRRIGANGVPEGEAANLSAAAESAIQPEVVIAPDGEATVAWNRFDGSHWLIQEQRLDSAGAPDGAVGGLSASGGDAAEPQLAIDAQGRATAVWERFNGSNFIVQARRLDPAGVPAAVRDLSATGRDAAEPQLALAPDGSATVLWSRFDGSNFVIQRRDLAADGTLGSLEAVSAPGRRASAPAVAWGAGDTLAMVWRRFAGSGDVVQAKTSSPPPIPPEPEPELEPKPEPEQPPKSTPGGDTHTASSSPPPGGSPAAASLQIEKVLLNRKKGTATLRVVVSGPGQLTLAGAVPNSRSLDGGGVTTLRVVPKPSKRRLLEQRGALRLQVTVTFQPLGGDPLSRQLTLRLKKSRPGTG
jgi:hypothetical protein